MNKEDSPAKYSIPKTISQSIYSYLKESIIENRIKANQKINEKEIASLFQVSITPAREAILRLGAEGFLTINSHREAVVKEISYKELKEISQIMGVLDSLAVSMAIDMLLPEDIREIEKMTETMEGHFHARAIEKYMELNIAIHTRIWKFVPNRFLQETLNYVSEQLLRYNYARYYAYQKPGALERSLKEHKEILKALRARNKQKLKTLISKHWGSILQSTSFHQGLKEFIQMNQGR